MQAGSGLLTSNFVCVYLTYIQFFISIYAEQLCVFEAFFELIGNFNFYLFQVESSFGH